MWKNDHIWNPTTCDCENSIYTKTINGNLVITCDGVLETTKSIMTKTFPRKSAPTNFNKKRQIVKWTISVFYLSFY